MDLAFVTTLLLILVLGIGGILAARHGLIESKGLFLAIALMVLLLIGYLLMGESGPS